MSCCDYVDANGEWDLSAVNRHILAALGAKRLHSLTPTDLRSLNIELAEGLAPRTVHYIRAVPRSALSQAVREGLVQRNVAALVRPPRAPRREVAALTIEAARALLQTARTTACTPCG